jgi:hypothetical protein
VIAESNNPKPDTSTEAVVEQKATPAIVDPPTPAELSAAAKFLKEKGHELKKVDGKPNWLPLPTVERMLEQYADGQRSQWDTRLSSAENEAKTVKGQIEQIRAAIQGDEGQFLAQIAQINPKFRRFLEQQAQPLPAHDPMPGPDVELADGSRTYSLDGLDARDAWRERQWMRKMDDRLKPFTERDQAEQAQTQLLERTRTQIQTAEAWPNWAEWKDDVLTTLQTDTAKTMTLREAYLEVKANRLSTDHNTVRESVVKEMANAPKSTAVRSGVEATRQPGPRSTAEIARQVIQQAESR